MGFLKPGRPLDFDSIIRVTKEIREAAIEQVIFSLRKNYDRYDEELHFGDESEYILVQMDNEARKAKLVTIALDVVQEFPKDQDVQACIEYGSHMVEMIPLKPFKSDLSSILEVQKILRKKRNALQDTIKSLGYTKCYPLQITSFPRLGCKDSLVYMENQPAACSNELSRSIFVPDSVISAHSRFTSLTQNIRKRRGAKVTIFAPIYIDKNTKIDKLDEKSPIAVELKMKIYPLESTQLPTPTTPTCTVSIDHNLSKNIFKVVERGYSFNRIKDVERKEVNYSNSISLDKLVSPMDLSVLKVDDKCEECPFSPYNFPEKATILNRKWVEAMSESGNDNPIPSYIYMDATGFGMGMCCYQTTFSFPNLDTARYGYDQLLALSPYFLALTASCPIFRGFVSATDTRWDVLSQSVDDRTETEFLYIPKSRYSLNLLYISNRPPLADNYFKFNDVLLPTDLEVYNKCINGGIDPILARHFSHLVIRTPVWLIDPEENTNINKCDSLAEFHAFQTTNWNAVRFKLPSLPLLPNGKSELGFRVEFRCPEMQLTDFENAAVAAVLLVLTKMIINNELNLYIPISYLELNMKRSSQQSAVHKTKFYYPTIINNEYIIKEDTLLNILFGEDGLFTKCIQYVKNEALKMNEEVGQRVVFMFENYMELFRRRCEGTLPTSACFIRQFVLLHELYKHDSVVSEEIAYDLCDLVSEIQSGHNHYSELLLGDLARYN